MSTITKTTSPGPIHPTIVANVVGTTATAVTTSPCEIVSFVAGEGATLVLVGGGVTYTITATNAAVAGNLGIWCSTGFTAHDSATGAACQVSYIEHPASS